MQFENALSATREQSGATLHGGHEGPIVMLNLLKFKAKATYASGEDVSGQIAYGRYIAGFAPLLAAEGGRVIYSGTVRNLMIGVCEDLWDGVAVVEYPSPQAFRRILTSDAYAPLAAHRAAGLEGQLLIETRSGPFA